VRGFGYGPIVKAAEHSRALVKQGAASAAWEPFVGCVGEELRKGHSTRHLTHLALYS
jgi:hypothetical protein